MISGIDDTTGEYHQASKKDWEEHYKRNFEKLIPLSISKINGRIRCIPCENYSARFDDEAQLVQHLRYNKKHVIDYFLANIEDPMKNGGCRSC